MMPALGRMLLVGVVFPATLLSSRADAAAGIPVRPGTPVKVMLPPRQVTVIEIAQLEKLPDVRDRADLALSAMEVECRDGAVTGVVHNIGNKPAPVVVALLDGDGNVVSSRSLGLLAAPLDLYPRRVSFRLEGAPADPRGWAIVVDPESEVSEIYEGNNRVALSALEGERVGEPAPPETRIVRSRRFE